MDSVRTKEILAETGAADSGPSGMEHAGVIDFFAHDTQTDVLLLVMVESRPWDDSDGQLFQLQEKFNAYVSFPARRGTGGSASGVGGKKCPD